MTQKTIAILALIIAAFTLAIAYMDFTRKTGMEMFSPVRK